MKKILGVAFFGSLILVLAFVFLGRGGKGAEPIAGDPTPGGASAAAASAAVSPTPTSSPAASAPTAAAPALSDTASCTLLSELCSTTDEKVDAAECEKKLADARKMSGAANVERSEQCLATAKTCAAATGCLSGGVGMGALGEFLKGLGSAISK